MFPIQIRFNAMSQFYTLEEAASKLNVSVDELRELAKSARLDLFKIEVCCGLKVKILTPD